MKERHFLSQAGAFKKILCSALQKSSDFRFHARFSSVAGTGADADTLHYQERASSHHFALWSLSPGRKVAGWSFTLQLLFRREHFVLVFVVQIQVVPSNRLSNEA